MAQITLNSSGVASNGSLVLQSNGTTTAVTIDSTQRAAFVAGTAAAPAITTSGDTNTGIFFPAADTIAFAEGGTESMRLDSSGNLGLGVTPSAWGSFKAIQSSYYSIWNHPSVNACYFGNNVYVTSGGTATYVATAPASQYQLYNGTHQWSTAASGTAGNTISFTQAMTLDASGNLLVGTTTPFLNASGRGLINVNGSSSSAIAFGVGGTRTGHIYTDTFELAIANNNGANGYIALQTNGAERARIDSSGRLLVGTTSQPSSSTKGFGVVPNSTVGYFIASGVSITTTCAHVEFYNPNGTVGSITTNSSSTTYATSSDYRLKENIAPMTGALATVAALKPCTYTWKATGEDGQGFIAHELQAVVPDAVVGEKDAVDEEGNPKYQGIDTSFLVATLTAAIQELNAKFEAYKAAHP